MRFTTPALALALSLTLAVTLAARADEASDLKALEGTWEAVSILSDGKETTGDAAKKITLTVKDGGYTYNLPKEVVKGKLVLGADKSPKTVDAVRTEGELKGSALKGIYELTEGTFKVCFGGPGKERPTSFDAKEGSGNRLTVWKKK